VTASAAPCEDCRAAGALPGEWLPGCATCAPAEYWSGLEAELAQLERDNPDIAAAAGNLERLAAAEKGGDVRRALARADVRRALVRAGLAHPQLWYVAHPVAPPCACDYGAHQMGDGIANYAIRQVECNCTRARLWFRWLLDAFPEVSLVASWLPYLDVLPDQGSTGAAWRERGLRDCEAVVQACTGIILVGGRISNGMNREAAAAVSAGCQVLDLTALGPLPPADHRGFALPGFPHSTGANR
jgi:hypothetical protein